MLLEAGADPTVLSVGRMIGKRHQRRWLSTWDIPRHARAHSVSSRVTLAEDPVAFTNEAVFARNKMSRAPVAPKNHTRLLVYQQKRLPYRYHEGPLLVAGLGGHFSLCKLDQHW